MGVQKIRARSDNSHLAWGYPPFLGRKTKGCSGVARETRGRHAGRVPESGRTDQGDTRRGGSPSVEMGICAEGPAGAYVVTQEARLHGRTCRHLPARVHGRTCRHRKGVLGRGDCRRCGHSIVSDHFLLGSTFVLGGGGGGSVAIVHMI